MIDTYRERQALQKFSSVFTRIEKEIVAPSNFGEADDAMQHLLIKNIMEHVEDIAATGAIGTTQKKITDGVIANLSLLGMEYDRAHKALGKKENADDRFAAGTIDLLAAYQGLSQEQGVTELEERYILLEKSRGEFGVAQEIVTQETALARKIGHNKNLAEDIHWLIAMKLVVTRFSSLFVTLNDILSLLEKTDKQSETMRFALNAWEPVDEPLILCKKILEESIEKKKNELSEIRDGVRSHQFAASEYFVVCKKDPFICQQAAHAVEYTNDVVQELLQGLQEVHNTYNTISELLLYEKEQELYTICTASQGLGSNDTIDQIKKQMEDLHEPYPVNEEENVQIDPELVGNGDEVWKDYNIEDILNDQSQWLQEKKDLEQRKGYMPQHLIDTMFSDFHGNTDGFAGGNGDDRNQ